MKNELALTENQKLLAGLRDMFRVVEVNNNRIDSLDGRVEQIESALEREVLITNRQASAVSFAVKARVREILDNKADYDKLGKKCFSALYRELYARFAIASYRDLPRKEFASVMRLIGEWFPVQKMSS